MRRIEVVWTLAPDGQGGMVQVNLPIIPDDADDELREGLGRRVIAALTRVCPCGATKPNTASKLAKASRAAARLRASGNRRRRAVRRAIVRAVTPHAVDCPANDALLDAAIKRWQQQKGADRGA